MKNLIEKALSAHQSQHYNDAILLYKQVLQQQDIPEVHNNLANIYIRLKEFSNAQKHLNHALQIKTDYIDARYNLALTYIQEQNNQQAITELTKILEQIPNHQYALNQLANLYMLENKALLAREYYQQLVALNPNDFLAVYNLAMSYIKLNDRETAFNYLKQAYELNSEDHDCLFNLGVIAQELNYLNRAIEFYEKLIKLVPNHIGGLTNLSICCKNNQCPEKALTYLSQIMSLQPHNLSVAYLHAALSGTNSPLRAPAQYIENLFDHYANHYDQHLIQHLQYQMPETLYQTIKPLNTKPWNIIELGCGTGLCGAILKSFAHTLIGIDLSPQMLNLATSKNHYDELWLSDIVDLQNQQADCLVAVEVFIYLGALSKIITTGYNNLIENGYFIFTVEQSELAPYQLTSSGRYAHHKDYISQCLVDSGFKNLQIKNIVTRTQYEIPVNSLLIVAQK